MKTKEEILKEKEELKKQLKAEDIEGEEYTKKEKELDGQLKLIKDNESIGSSLRVIKICLIIITSILAFYTVIVAATWFSSLAYTDDYTEWSDDGEEVDDLEGVEF